MRKLARVYAKLFCANSHKYRRIGFVTGSLICFGKFSYGEIWAQKIWPINGVNTFIHGARCERFLGKNVIISSGRPMLAKQFWVVKNHLACATRWGRFNPMR